MSDPWLQPSGRSRHEGVGIQHWTCSCSPRGGADAESGATSVEPVLAALTRSRHRGWKLWYAEGPLSLPAWPVTLLRKSEAIGLDDVLGRKVADKSRGGFR